MSFKDFLRESREPYRRLASYLRPYTGRFVLGLLFGALYGVANGVFVYIMRFAGNAVLGGGNVGGDMGMSWTPIPKSAGAPAELQYVVLVCLAIPLAMMFRGICSYMNAYCMLWVSQRVLDDIRNEVYRHTLGQSMEFFNRQKAGELVQTVFNQTRMAQQALTTVASDLVKQPISILSALAVLFWHDWKFTLGALTLFPLCLLPVVLISKKVRKSGAREEEEAGQLMVLMHEAFAGVRVVKTHAREDYEVERFKRANQSMLRFVMRWRKALELTGPLVETVASLGISAALVYAWYFKMQVGDFTALLGGLVLLYPAFKALSRVQLMMQKCLASTTKVFELLDRPPAIVDRPDAQPLQETRGEIRFDQVSFTYTGKEMPAVHSLDLVIPQGTTCALVGQSGAGKSTVLALLQRLYEVQSGAISIDGRDIRTITQASLRENIATVSQDTFLFHDTILQNIRYGRLDATREEIEQAARLAYAHDFIMAQPQGYDTVVGDKGCNLSGGQQQRISIARALLKDAPILLLDEAMSALDSESERAIQAAVETLSRGRTVIAIAHRLSTILKADQIVVMEGGAIVEIGAHAQLYQRDGQYRKLYDLQFSHDYLDPAPAEA